MKTVQEEAKESGYNAGVAFCRGGKYPNDEREAWARKDLEYSFDAGFAQGEREYQFIK